MQTNHTRPNSYQPPPIDEVLLPHEAAAFLGLTEEQLMTATLQGNCPGACIDGHWRFSQRGLSKYLLQQSNHGTGMPWLDEHYGPYWLDDAVESKARKVIERYQAGERYFPLLEIEGGNFAGLDLTGIDFWESNLKGSSFKGATLQNAVFVGCNLESASFAGADLTDADFRSASVRGSDFRGAILKRTIFRVRSWRGVNLDGAQISLAKF
ncbi:pentapeptide repeat-containing protein [Acaryochloris marina NIES-2412]|uniref:pentapeptide repeat-containing protein n=1 Tax=Acaryochloris marina TaxID=155978 RepID=UPI0040591807